MSIKRKLFAAAATLTLVGCVGAVATMAATAATPACGANCISIFSKEIGNYQAPGVVEDTLGGVAKVGQPVILKPGSVSDTSEDNLPVGGKVVADFYQSGMVSAAVNKQYAGLKAAQIEFAPGGNPTGLCVGLAKAPYKNEGLTLQHCNVPGLTVWIIDTPDSPATAATGYFPIVNAATTDFVHPYAMDLPDYEVANSGILQIRANKLQFVGTDRTLPDRQLWGAHFGVSIPLP
jgi:hypothetical protein